MQLKPLPGYALVRLKEKYESGLSTDKEKYTERSEGTLISVSVRSTSQEVDVDNETWGGAVGCEVYFAPYTEGEAVKHDGAEYVFLPLKELRGVKSNA